ncbi:MAG: type II toxin-antitoxin system MqsA family antitoxin [Deltaproteobacteria bacterium]|nr:type II toxin-antitoxin system MqsA family antitoxin [Deltaproteobacteria bacterium]
MTHGPRQETFSYKGQEATVRVRGDFCDRCGEAIFDGTALEVRQVAFLEMRARMERVLGPREVTAIRKKSEAVAAAGGTAPDSPPQP